VLCSLRVRSCDLADSDQLGLRLGLSGVDLDRVWHLLGRSEESDGEAKWLFSFAGEGVGRILAGERGCSGDFRQAGGLCTEYSVKAPVGGMLTAETLEASMMALQLISTWGA